MKLRSSIFSSDTLSAEWRIPTGAALAIALVIIANLWAYYAEKNGKLYTSIPRQMIENSIDKLTNSKGVWFLGNSTLAAGFNEDMLDDKVKQNSAIIELGSATLDTTVRLSEIALENGGKPEIIMLFFTKDDLNQNGSRAKASKSYHQAISSPELYEYIASAIPVYSTRYAITDQLRNGIAKTTLSTEAKASGKKNHKKIKTYKDLSTQIDTTYLLNLGHDYKPAEVNFSRLGELAKKSGTTLYLISPPVTTAISRWQTRFAPEYPWSDIMQNITHKANEAGITVLNYTNLLESSTQYFKDTYHLNSSGSKSFTKHLLSDTMLNTPEAAVHTL